MSQRGGEFPEDFQLLCDVQITIAKYRKDRGHIGTGEPSGAGIERAFYDFLIFTKRSYPIVCVTNLLLFLLARWVFQGNKVGLAHHVMGITHRPVSLAFT